MSTHTSASELLEVRAAVRQLVESFGAADYYQDQVDQGGHCADLWNAMGANGYLGVHLPVEYGGGGLGLAELATVVEETAFSGCPLLALLFSAGVTSAMVSALRAVLHATIESGNDVEDLAEAEFGMIETGIPAAALASLRAAAAS